MFTLIGLLQRELTRIGKEFQRIMVGCIQRIHVRLTGLSARLNVF